jgi:hypothetical protein
VIMDKITCDLRYYSQKNNDIIKINNVDK